MKNSAHGESTDADDMAQLLHRVTHAIDCELDAEAARDKRLSQLYFDHCILFSRYNRLRDLLGTTNSGVCLVQRSSSLVSAMQAELEQRLIESEMSYLEQTIMNVDCEQVGDVVKRWGGKKLRVEPTDIERAIIHIHCDLDRFVKVYASGTLVHVDLTTRPSYKYLSRRGAVVRKLRDIFFKMCGGIFAVPGTRTYAISTNEYIRSELFYTRAEYRIRVAAFLRRHFNKAIIDIILDYALCYTHPESP